MSKKPYTITTWLWNSQWRRDQYTYRDVNRLNRMLQDHLSLPYRLVCFTDTPQGIHPSVEVMPLPAQPSLFDFTNGGPNCFVRLWLFTPAARRSLGTEKVLNLDLDCLITGDLSPMLRCRDRFKINAKADTPRHYNGAMFSMELGSNPAIYHDLNQAAFDKAKFFLSARGIPPVGSDQVWLTHKIKHAPTWNEDDGVHHLWFKTNKRDLPKNCKVLFLSGGSTPAPGSPLDRVYRHYYHSEL